MSIIETPQEALSVTTDNKTDARRRPFHHFQLYYPAKWGLAVVFLVVVAILRIVFVVLVVLIVFVVLIFLVIFHAIVEFVVFIVIVIRHF